MTALAVGASATTSVRDGGTVTIATNGGFGSAAVTLTEGGVLSASFGPAPERRVLGPFWEGATIVLSNASCDSLLYDVATSVDPASVTTTTEYIVVLLAGQSNMVGTKNTVPLYTFDATNDPTDPRILQWSFDGQGTPALANTLLLAQDPLLHPGAPATNRSVGPGMPFARTLLASLLPHQRIILVPTAVGGTGLINDTWNATGVNFLNSKAALTAVLAAIPNSRCDFILWWQGENDMFFDRSDTAYMTQFDAVLDSYRSVTGAGDAVVLIGGVVLQYWAGSGVKPLIQQALANTPLRKARCYYLPPPVDAFTPSDSWHAQLTSQRIMGTTWGNSRGLAARYGNRAPAATTATLDGEVVRIIPNGAPAYVIKYRAAGSNGAYTELITYPHKDAATTLYEVLPGSGSREFIVVARSLAGDSAPTATITYTVPVATVPQAYWDHDYNTSTYDGSANLTAVANVGSNATAWTQFGTPQSVLVNGVKALNITDSAQALRVAASPPAGDYTFICAYQESFSDSGPQLFGVGELTANVGLSVSRTLKSSVTLGAIGQSHSGASFRVTEPFVIKKTGYVCIAVVYTLADQTVKIYINGSLFLTTTTVTRANAPSVKAWNQLADGRGDACPGTKLAWKYWNSALTAAQVQKVAHDIKTKYGIEWTT